MIVLKVCYGESSFVLMNWKTIDVLPTQTTTLKGMAILLRSCNDRIQSRQALLHCSIPYMTVLQLHLGKVVFVLMNWETISFSYSICSERNSDVNQRCNNTKRVMLF